MLCRLCPRNSDSPLPWPRTTLSFVCQNCGAAYNRWQGKCESCGEWNTLAEEDTTGATTMPVSIRSQAQGPAVRAGNPDRQEPGRPSPALRHGRTRPRHRRRLCSRLGAAGRRRSRHRQIDAVDPGHQPDGARRASRGLHLRRRSGGAGAAARRAARPCRCAGAARRRNLGRGHRLDAVGRRGAAPDRDRFDPDHVDRHRRIRARHGDAGARLGAGADPIRQEIRRRDHPGRPRDQGRPDRRPPRGRAHGRCGAVVRGRRLAAVPHPARGRRTASARPTRSACSR